MLKQCNISVTYYSLNQINIFLLPGEFVTVEGNVGLVEAAV